MVCDNAGDVYVGSLPSDGEASSNCADEADGFGKQGPERERRLDFVVETGHETLHGRDAGALGLGGP